MTTMPLAAAAGPAGGVLLVVTALVVGRLQRYARSGFKRLPSEHLDASLALIL